MDNYSYNKELKRFEFFDQRFYTDDDGETYFPSVTHVLDCFPKDSVLLDWIKDMGRNADVYIKDAGTVGTNVHNLIDQFLQNPGVEFPLVNDSGEPMYSKLEWKMALKALEFFDMVKPEVISTEQNIISRSLRIGGTLDLGCKIRGKVSLVDHKTSNSIQTTHWIQTAVYAKLWNEIYPEDQQIETCYVLWLKADTRGESNIGKPTEPTVRKLPNKKKDPERRKKDTDESHQERLDENEADYQQKIVDYHESAKERTLEYTDKLKEWEQTRAIQGRGWQLKEMVWKMPEGEDDLTGPAAIDKYYKLYRCCRYFWDYLNPNFKPFNRKFPDRIKYTP